MRVTQIVERTCGKRQKGECTHVQQGQDPWWAALTVWGVVNSINVLQSVGFLSRIRSGNMKLNHRVGHVMIALAAPTLVALIAFVRSRAGVLTALGPIVYLCFVVLMLAVDYIAPVEFRSRSLNGVLVTVATSAVLIASMVAAIRKGAG